MNLLEATISRLPSDSTDTWETAVRNRWDTLTKPRGSLGVLEECVVRLGAIQGTFKPIIDRQAMYIFCGDHGITEEGVSAYPSVVTREMMKNFVQGGAAINVLCRAMGIATHVIDAGIIGPRIEGVIDRRVADGTRNFAHEPAMSSHQALTALEVGINLAAEASKTGDLVGVGEMGIGNSTAASALLCALIGVSPAEATGRGAGLDDDGLQRKQKVLTAAIAFHHLNPDDPLKILATFGGFEIAMMTGFLLGAAAHRLPVVIDGFISSAAFLVAQAVAQTLTRTCPPLLNRFVFFSHRSAEPGHHHLLSYLNANPLLALDMRLGEGSGAALAIGLLTSAVNLYDGMATFEEAAVSGAE